ncbi:MAG: BamA/TamA family outer membrane protein [Saprospiraceae bacterium]|nr:BamA/TamA family outer membrane protein [Saprospiraceae bacterium]
MKSVNIAVILLGLILLCSCSATRHLSPEQQLFAGSEIRFEKSNPPLNKRFLKSELLNLTRPKANKPIRLGLYNLVKEPKRQKGFKYWLKYKIGEAPVLYDPAAASRSRIILEKYLKDHGYLNAEVQLDTVVGSKKVQVIYDVSANQLFRINNIFLPKDSTVLDQLVRDNQQQSLLKKRQIYLAENLRLERSRLATIATQNGYYGVTEDDIYFYVDTSNYADSLDVYVRWKPDLDSTSFKKYLLGRTTVYPSYSLVNSNNIPDTIFYDDLIIIEDAHYFNSELLRSAIRGKKGYIYDGRLQTSTINYLQNLDVFKFINLKTEKRIENGRYYLDRIFYLTPTSFRNVRYDFEANTRSGSYLGILAAANYANRNWLGGAENLGYNFSIGGETQIGNPSRFINTLEVSAGISLAIPRLFTPFYKPKLYKDYVARTRFNLSDAFQIRTGFFNLNRLTAQIAYDWRTNRNIRHLLTPISISHNQTFNIDSVFQQQLDQSILLRSSLENIFILGGQYQFTYSNQDIGKIKPYFFFSSNFEMAGNIPFALANLISPNEKPYGVLGSPFSQFLKLYLDGRYYFQRRTHTWANRLAAGVVVPYGNVDVAPYSEQFFIGGSTSLRAFHLRELGPGSYVNPDIQELNFFDQTGNIKLELNTEYRFDLFSYFKGAVFFDAGNIWLLNQTIGDNQGGQFRFDTFLDEIAVGTGLGLRVDFDFFLIRLDGAFPLRKPVYNQGFAWTFKQLNFLDKAWRTDNLVWHLAIGYPF